jgi:branched-chain amino acid transport system ATP-binding protein
MAEPLLALEGVETSYGRSQVLFGVTLAVEPGQVVTLLGRNGMGKTTTVRSLMGMTPATRGSIRFRGQELRELPSYRVAQLGLGLVPEGRQVFPNLTVRENLVATASRRARDGAARWDLPQVFELFPRLAERRHQMASVLSGGEQQMLAIGRALMTNPLLLIADEATEGLAPIVRDDIWACFTRLKSMGQAILLIDKNLDDLLEIADRHYILEKGRVVWSGDSAALATDERLQNEYLGI